MKENDTAFIHLKVHSEYSLCDGIVRIKALIKRCKSDSIPAVAITDHVNLFALVKFYTASTEAGIKPIVGADLILQENGERFVLTALCQNQEGYHNLTRLLSRAYVDGQINGNPLISRKWLEEFNAGLLILSGAQFGDVGQAILNAKTDLIESRLAFWKRYFPSRYYLELQRVGRPNENDYIRGAVELAAHHHLPIVATNDVRFLEQDDFEAHEARVCIHDGYVLADTKRPHHYTRQQYFKSTEEMRKLFSDIPEALQNTVEIAKRCSMPLTLGESFLPKFPAPNNSTEPEYLSAISEGNLEKYLSQRPDLSSKKTEYEARLKRELDVITRMGFSGYFLIVADFINWAKQQKIPVGPGRGSGAGSLAAFVLGITALDPLQHELLFERFLNPERVSMPDFDIDFCMEKRDRVIEYVANQYGREAVSQIITFGTMAARAVVRDVGRVLNMPYGFIDKIAKLIPFEIGMTLEKAMEQEIQLKDRYAKEDEVSTLIDLAKSLEGITRNAGKHAGGVVIAPTKLTDFAPLFCEPGGVNLVTQFDKDDVEAVGLVKFDFLGLRTLTIIDWALDTINRKRKEPLNIEHLPLDDAPTFSLLQKCQTTAVFQLESRGMKDLIRRLQPDNFEEITALVALFRPGPLQSGMVDDFIDRKHGRSNVDYAHPELEPILKPTYGVILYQEQVMQIAQTLAGYSLGSADILRRAMGKKKPEEMAKQREFFISGAKKRNIPEEISAHIFDLMEKFAGYGFNKSHSAAYALIAYQTAWLKAHYPAEFMAAVLSSDMDNTDKVAGFIEECKHMKLRINPPNVNRGFYKFTVNEQGEIEYGLGAIKGAGEAAIELIVAERQRNHDFSNLFEFCQRLDIHKVNRRVLDAFIYSGAMDVLKVSRASVLASIDKALKFAEQGARNRLMGQVDLFGDEPADDRDSDYVSAEPWDELTQLKSEKAVLGLYLSGHPLHAYEAEIQSFGVCNISDLARHRQQSVSVAGILLSLRKLITRSGKRMAVATFEDQTGRAEVAIFSKLYDTMMMQLEVDQVFVVKAKVEDDEFTKGVRLVAESMQLLDDLREKCIKRLVVTVNNQEEVESVLKYLPTLIEANRGGRCPISIAYQGSNAHAQLQLGESFKVSANTRFLEALKKMCGHANVVAEY
jgi:DNA polymerase-3 subunit alpha